MRHPRRAPQHGFGLRGHERAGGPRALRVPGAGDASGAAGAPTTTKRAPETGADGTWTAVGSHRHRNDPRLVEWSPSDGLIRPEDGLPLERTRRARTAP